MTKTLNKNKNNKYLTAKQIADTLQLHPQYVRDLARFGHIPAKKTGREWRFDLKEVERQLNINALKAIYKPKK